LRGCITNLLNKDSLILSWKLVDHIPFGDTFSAQERKGFSNSRRAKLSDMQMCNLRTSFFSLRDKYKYEIKKTFFPESISSGYFRLAGGHYSFVFVLGNVLKDVAESNRMQSIHLKLYELRGDDDLLNEFDVAFSSKYKDAKKHDKGINNFTKLKKLGFSYSKQFYEDEVSFAVSKEVIKEQGNAKEVLDKHPLIGLKLYRSEGSNRKQISVPYPIKPEGRTDMPRITSDSLYFNYKLMKASFGLWVLFKSQLKEDDLKVVSKPTTFIERHYLYNSHRPTKMMLAAKKSTFQYLKNIDKINNNYLLNRSIDI
jgi:hypothetical protein